MLRRLKMKTILSDKTYDYLKWIALVLIPAVATLIGAIGGYVQWENTDLTVYVLVAVDTFIGTLLGVSTVQYNQNK